MEWLFVLVVALIIFGPVIWALTAGRRGGAPAGEDAGGASAYGWLIRRLLRWGAGFPVGSRARAHRRGHA